MSATSQNKELFNDYEGFVEKFKPKKTTDDCYTPPIIYEAVVDWVSETYGLNKGDFCRPFYPGGDYEHFTYDGRIVVDNPPFSILSQIVKNYIAWGIKFFLFAPTLSSLVRLSDLCTSLAVGVDITYENGATICTSFVTNLEPEHIRMRTRPDLYRVVHEANAKNRKEQTRQLPKYVYPLSVVSSAAVYPYSKYGIDFVIPRKESVRISGIDAQKSKGKNIFGCGLLISDSVKAEREKAEREKAEREKAEREKAERWELSERELNIIAALNQQGGIFIKRRMKDMRELKTIQKREKLNRVYTADEKGVGGANHEYVVVCGGTPVEISFQHGPRKDPDSVNGVLDTDLLEIVRDRLIGFQSGEFATRENAIALTHIEEALFWMNKRVEDRIERGVLGTTEK